MEEVQNEYLPPDRRERRISLTRARARARTVALKLKGSLHLSRRQNYDRDPQKIVRLGRPLFTRRIKAGTIAEKIIRLDITDLLLPTFRPRVFDPSPEPIV